MLPDETAALTKVRCWRNHCTRWRDCDLRTAAWGFNGPLYGGLFLGAVCGSLLLEAAERRPSQTWLVKARSMQLAQPAMLAAWAQMIFRNCPPFLLLLGV